MTLSTIIAVILLGQLHFQINCLTGLVYESEIKNDGRTVLLGGLFPIHASNGTGTCGDILHESTLQRVEAMVHTINNINEKSELLPKIKLAFSIRDTCGDPSYGLEQAFQYVQPNSINLTCSSSSGDHVAVSGVIGAQVSQVSIDIANLLQLYRIPQISYISTVNTLGDKARFDYFFRTIPPDSLQARVIADIIVLFKWTFVFMLYSDDAYGNGGIEALIENLTLRNKTICIAAKIPLSPTASSREYDEAISTMSQDFMKNATVVVLFGNQKDAVGTMEALRRAQMQGDYNLSNLTWIGSDAWGNSLPGEYHSIARGMLSVSPQAIRHPTFDNYFTSLSPNNYSSNVWFNELWETRFGCSLSRSNTCGILQANMTLNTTDYKQADYITLVSDAVFAFAHAIHNLVDSRCPNSTLCDDILEERLLGKAINGELLQQQLYNISFQGPSSNIVSFDKDGIEMGVYFIKNLQRNQLLEDTFTFVTIGTWDPEQSFKFVSDIEWPTGGIPKSICSEACEGGKQPIPIAEKQCCWICTPCQSERGFSDGMSACQDCNESMMPDSKNSMCIPIPISHMMFNSRWSIVLITFTIFGQVATAIVIIVFLAYNRHRVVKASSRELSAILLVGLVLCYTMPFFFVAKPSPVLCTIRRFFFGVCFAVCFSALLVKTNRIYRIFNQKSLNPTKVPRFISSLSQVIMTFILIAVQVIIAIIWLIVDNPSTAINYGTRSAELRCGESPFVYLAASLGYNLILLLLCTYFAFLARKVPENFNEAKYINITLYTLCIIWLAFISTYCGTIKFGDVFQVTSLVIAIILSATTTLLCIFVPRVVLLISRLKEKQKNNTVTTSISNLKSFSVAVDGTSTQKIIMTWM